MHLAVPVLELGHCSNDGRPSDSWPPRWPTSLKRRMQGTPRWKSTTDTEALSMRKGSRRSSVPPAQSVSMARIRPAWATASATLPW